MKQPQPRRAQPSGVTRGQAGLTLVEMAVVIAVIAITALGVVAVVGTALSDSSARVAAEQVGVALRLARQNALTSGAIYQVTTSASSIRIACTPGTPAGNVCPAGRPPDTTESVTPGTVLTPSANPFNFGPTGTATVGTIRVSHPDAENWEVAVNAAGRIRSCSPACP